MSTSTEPAENRPPAHPPARPERKNSLPVLLGVLLLIIGLIAGGLLWFFLGNARHSPPRARVFPSATASSIPTWMPTEITPPAQSIFYDTFVNNSHGWSLTGDSVAFRLLVDNMLILANENPDTTFVESVPTSTNLSNYQVSIDFTIGQGDAFDSTGLYLRGDSNLDHDYRVDINGNGTIDIVKEWLDSNLAQQTTTLFPSHHTSYLKWPGRENTLTVIMLDATIVVEINGFVLTTVYDSSYASGQVALFARHGTRSRGIVVSFSRVEIDRLAVPSDMLTPTPMVTPTP